MNSGNRQSRQDSDAHRETRNTIREHDVLNGSVSKLNANTLQDAYNIIVELTREQIRLASENSAPFNVSIEGDAVVRLLIKSLLPLSFQRRVYFESINSLENASRSVCMFGAPPYPFLLPTDNTIFNASGMARRRVNMSYSTTLQRTIVNVAHFGASHMTDNVMREYRIVQEDQSNDAPIALDSLDAESLVDMYVKLPLRRKRARDQDHSSVSFTPPRIGETIELTSSRFIRNVLDQNYAVVFVVKGLRMEKNSARVCLIRAQCLSKHNIV